MIKGLLHRFRPRARGGKDELDGSERYGSEILATQFDMRARLTWKMAAAGFVGDIGVYLVFRDNPDNGLLWVTIVALPILYVVLIGVGTLWLRLRRQHSRDIDKVRFWLVATVFLVGINWGSIFIEGMLHATPEQTSVLYAVAIGVIASSAFSGPKVYAIALWAPSLVGVVIALWYSNIQHPVTMTVAMGAYGLLSLSTIISVDKRDRSREEERIKAQRNKEMVDILLRDFEEGSSDWLFETDETMALVNPSERFAQATGMAVDGIKGRSFIEFLHAYLIGSVEIDPKQVYKTLVETLQRREPFNNLLIAMRFDRNRFDGNALDHKTRWWSLTGKPIFDAAGEFTGFRGVISDVTDVHEAHREIQRIAWNDGLTNFKNRRSFDIALAEICQQPGPDGATLMCLDLDGFKAVNDTYGHQVGDSVLTSVARRINAGIRGIDSAYRLGGDEFALILQGGDKSVAETVAARLIERVSAPMQMNGVTLNVGVSIGVTTICSSGRDPDEIRYEADLALYHAKESGKRMAQVYDKTLDYEIGLRQDLSFEMSNKFTMEGFFLEFQPIIDIDSGRTAAAEALVRWNHPKYNRLSPDKFIAIAEQTGAIIPLGGHVIELSCRFAAQTPDDLAVSINLSPLQLRDETLCDTIAEAIARHGIAPGRLEFELTETALLSDTENAAEVLDRIRSIGCRINLDDFGAGYSSLAVLTQYRFDTVKLDRSLITDATKNDTHKILLAHVARLSRDLGFELTGEGVETLEHIDLLRDLGFDKAQGFHIARPLAGATFLDRLQEEQVVLAAA